jgi:hypothetical protein
MTFAKYAPRVRVHDTRHGPIKTSGPNLWIVIHTSEGAELTGSAEQLGLFMGTPATKTNVASYQEVFDTDQVIPAVPHNVVSYAAAGGNAQGIHGCFPGKAGQTREQWLDLNSRAMIRQCAAWCIDVSREQNIPLTRIYSGDLIAGRRGICDHHQVSLAFKRSTHTDVGPGFPWDVLFSDIEELLTPPKPIPAPAPIPTDPILGDDEDMSTKTLLHDTRNDAVYLCDATTKVWIDNGNVSAQLAFRVQEAMGNTPDYSQPAPPWPAALRLSSHVAIDGHRYSVVTHGDPNLIASFGPIIGRRPASVDDYGR